MKLRLFAAALVAAASMSFANSYADPPATPVQTIICPGGSITYGNVPCPAAGSYQCQTGQAWSKASPPVCAATVSTRVLGCSAGATAAQVANAQGIRHWQCTGGVNTN